MKALLILSFLLISIIGNTARYYVSNTGNDSNTGLSDAQAWLTCSKVSWGYTHTGGDTISFKCGNIWKETLYVYGSGGIGNPIVINSYGTGAKPIITGYNIIPNSQTTGSWTNVSGNIWSINFTAPSGEVNRLWLNGVEVKDANSNTVTATAPFHYSSAKVYVYATANPATAYSTIESGGVLAKALYVKGSNLTFDGLDIQGGGDASCRIQDSDNLIIKNCNIGWHTDRNGIDLNSSEIGVICENGLVYDCTFDTGQTSAFQYTNIEQAETLDGISLAENCTNWEIYNCYFKDWGHSGIAVVGITSDYTMNNISIHHNYFTSPNIYYGRGFTCYMKYGTNMDIHNNYVYDCSVQSQISGQGALVYNNIFDNNNSECVITAKPYQTGAGLSVQNVYDIVIEDMQIINNTIANCYDAGLLVGLIDGATAYQNNLIANNIITNCGQSSRSHYSNIFISSYVDDNTWQNNISYDNNGTDVYYDSANRTMAEFNVLNGDGGNIISGNLSVNPLFVSDTNLSLQSGSPAINAGINTGIATDYLDNQRTGIIDIGAYEYYYMGWKLYFNRRNGKYFY